MRTTSSSREPRCLVRGRRFLVSNKQKKSVSPSKTVKPKSTFLENGDLDRSFKECAYPNVAEILRLSEQLELPPVRIKSEFQRRRQAFRQRHKLPEDTIIYNHTLPRIYILLQILFSQLTSAQRTLVQVTVFMSSVFSLWYSVYRKIGLHNCNQEILLLT